MVSKMGRKANDNMIKMAKKRIGANRFRSLFLSKASFGGIVNYRSMLEMYGFERKVLSIYRIHYMIGVRKLALS